MLTNSTPEESLIGTAPAGKLSPITDSANSRLLVRDPKSRETIIRPNNNSVLTRLLVIGGGIASIYTFIQTAPLLTLLGVAAMGFYFRGEIKNAQSPQKAELLKMLMEAKIPTQPSISDIRKELRENYPADVVNRAIEEMIPCCKLIRFHVDDDHYLAPYGEVYCYVDRDTRRVMTPLDGLIYKLDLWGIKPAPKLPSKKKGERGSRPAFEAIDVPAETVDKPQPSFRVADIFKRQSPAEDVTPTSDFDSMSPTVIVGPDTKLNAVPVAAQAIDNIPEWKPEEIAEEVKAASMAVASVTPSPWEEPKPADPEREKAEALMRRVCSKKPPVSFVYRGKTVKGWNAADMAMFFKDRTRDQWCFALSRVAALLPESYTWDASMMMLVKKP